MYSHSVASARPTRIDLRNIAIFSSIASSLCYPIATAISDTGLTVSFFNTFGISVIVWGAIAVIGMLTLEKDGDTLDGFDLVVFSAFLVVNVLPLGAAAWGVTSLLGAYLIVTSCAASNRKRIGWIMLLLTFSTFWGRRLFALFSDFFLGIDARLVSYITQTDRQANLVKMPNTDGFLQIADACSSFANVSLAMLCWTTFSQFYNIKWSPRSVGWVSLCTSLIVLVNVVRISLIGFFPSHYHLLHGEIGSTVVSYIYMIICVYICHRGTRYEQGRAA